jgi:hypothetical protein
MSEQGVRSLPNSEHHDPLCRYVKDSFTGNEHCDCKLIALVRLNEISNMEKKILSIASRSKTSFWGRVHSAFRRRS